MTAPAPLAAVTGASGYLGSRICSDLESNGFRVIKLVRSPERMGPNAVAYDLASPISAEVEEVLGAAAVLVHTAYDLSLTRMRDIWQVNVEGTRSLMATAVRARVGRIIALSSMSAFEGTKQLYGKAKLDIEAITIAAGGCALRPGVVFGQHAGGMAGAITKLTTLPVVPMIAGRVAVYTVQEDDLLAAIITQVQRGVLDAGTFSAAHSEVTTLREILKTLAAREGGHSILIPVPWQLVYCVLRVSERLGLHLPFRADSLLGLVHRAPQVVNAAGQLSVLGVEFRSFAAASAEPG